MKRLLLILLLAFSFSLASAVNSCSPNVILLNQDPYPANPGEYLKVVFQISNIASHDCGNINFRLMENYPIIFDPNENGVRNYERVDYLKDFSSSIMVPFRVRIDPQALDGKEEMEIQIQTQRTGAVLRKFDLEIKDMKPSFEIFVEDYDASKNQITFQILNTGKTNVQALAIEVPRQDNIIIKGPNRVVVGDLDSKEYTTATFEAQPINGQINLIVHYSDENNVRRNIAETTLYDSDYFENKFSETRTTSALIFSIVVIVFLFLLIIIMIYLGSRILKATFRKKTPRASF
jgi:hypothetical protein